VGRAATDCLYGFVYSKFAACAKIEKTMTKDEKMNVKKVSLKQSYEDSRALAKEIAGYLSDKKADKIVIIDIGRQTPIADYFVICSVRSSLAVRALTDYVDEVLSKKGIEPCGRDIDVKWAAVDYGSVILHIFYEETRNYYQLERLWTDGDNVETVE